MKAMTPEWYITIISDPQGLWKLLQLYLTAPFTGSNADATILSEYLDALLNHSLGFLAIALFVLLGGLLLVCAVVTASETRREKKEQMERQLAKQQHRDEKLSLDFSVLEEREEFDRG